MDIRINRRRMGLYGHIKSRENGDMSRSKFTIRRRAILDIATFTEQNMYLKPMTAILNIRSTEIYKVGIQRLKYRTKNKSYGQAVAL